MTNPTPPRDDAPELLPCPFCGGTPHSFTPTGRSWVAMRCQRCEMITPYFQNGREAVAAWNRRADQPARVGVARERVAVALWQDDLGDSAPSVRKARTLAHFRDQMDEVQAKFLRNADVAIAALLPTEAGAEPVASRVYVGGEASVAVCSFCDISGCHHIRATNTTPPAAPTDNTALVEALKPFGDAVYNDNGDVTIDQSHLTRGHWLSARAALSRPAPQAVTDNTALVECLQRVKRIASLYGQGQKGIKTSEAIQSAIQREIDAALSRPAPQAVTVEECLEAINQVKVEAQADLYGATNDFNRGAVDAIDRAYARVRALGGLA